MRAVKVYKTFFFSCSGFVFLSHSPLSPLSFMPLPLPLCLYSHKILLGPVRVFQYPYKVHFPACVCVCDKKNSNIDRLCYCMCNLKITSADVSLILKEKKINGFATSPAKEI